MGVGLKAGGGELSNLKMVLAGTACVLAAVVGQPGAAQEENNDPIPDTAFEAALPPLEDTDPAPLNLGPEPDPAPEFTTPLQPLETFDDTPPRELSASDESEALAEVRYTVEVAGLEELGLEERFLELSALQEGRGQSAPSSQIRLRAEEDIELARNLLRAEGYYDAGVSATFSPPTGKTDRLDVILTAIPGSRYSLGDIRLVGSDPAPTAIAREALTVQTGDPIVATAVEAAEANVTLRLPQEGYPFAELGLRDIVLDEATRRGDYTLPLTSGPKAAYGGFQVSGRPVFGAAHVAVLARFGPGEIYDSREVEDLRQALVATSLLSTVSVEPVRTGRVAPSGAEIVDLRVRQVPARPRSLAATVGYGTGEGFRVSGSWAHRNLFPPEGALALNAVAGTEEQRLAISFRRSNAGQRDRTIQATAGISRETREAYDATSANLSAMISRESTPLWQKRWTYSIGAEVIATNETLITQEAESRPRETFVIAALPSQLGYDTSDSLLDPTRGFRITGRLSPEASHREETTAYARTLLETSAYAPLGERMVIAGRVRLGAVAGVARDDLAPSRRLYAGGGGSVRGFGFQDLGPHDANNRPLGGRSLVELSLEARYRWGDFGIVPFIDAGQVYEASTPEFGDLRVGVGIGGRYYTPFGPLRIDVATPLSRRSGEPSVALYISIGQAF